MEDLLGKLQEILGSEEGQQQLRSVAQMLGMDTKGNESSSDSSGMGKLDLSSLGDLFSSKPHKEQSDRNTSESQPNLSGIDLDMLMKIQKVVSTMNMEDDNTRLLMALKPHFSDSRKVKIDKAIQMLRIFSLLPMIRESGLLGGLLGDGGK